MKFSTFFTFLIFTSISFSQEKVEWTYNYNPSSKVIELKADLADGWHLYSQHIANDVGPVPTTFVFESSSSFKLIGKVDEPKPIREYDENFEALLEYFEGEVIFSQRIAFKKNITLQGTVTYMACNATQCLPPVDEKFTIELTTE
jgi:thiol:disulfide interchange protein DsbD